MTEGIRSFFHLLILFGFLFFFNLIKKELTKNLSVFFLVKAWKQGRALGIDKAKLRNAITSSALFTVPSALSVLATVIALAPALGLVIPWVRLSVIGNLMYETTAAEAAMEAMGGYNGSVAVYNYKTGEQVGEYWKPGEDPHSIEEGGIVVSTFEKYGFSWGGNSWQSNKDYMHFSYLGR